MSQHINESRWFSVLVACGVRTSTADRWAPLWEQHVQPERFSLDLRELDDFTSQVLHETARLECLSEGLSYSADRIRELGMRSAPGSRWRSLVPMADRIARNPRAFANAAYGGRMGNTEPDDGFRFAGKGIPMVTGRDNYRLLERLTGMPLVAEPQRLLDPEMALQCAVLWWEKAVPDSAIDSVERVTRAVNGGTIGIEDRKLLAARAAEALA